MKNKNLKLKIKKIFFQFAIFYLLFTISSPVFAQTTLPLTVIPARHQIEVEPGEKYSLTVNFYNQSESPISGFFQVADFIVVDEKGTIQLIENPDDAPVKYSASKWVNLLYNKATLPANEKVSLQVDINVPKDAHPGGRYLAIFFQSAETLKKQNENKEEAGSGTSLRISSLVYIKVKGEIKEKALISRFFAPNFLEYGPIKITTDILNRGDYHITPRGVFTLTNYFGAAVDQKTLKEKNIFPETSRNYQVELGKKWLIGRYKIDFLGSYGEKGQALTAAIYVWVFPWRIALIIVLTLIIVYLVATNLYKSLIVKEASLEEEIKKEKEEIERLKKQLEKRE